MKKDVEQGNVEQRKMQIVILAIAAIMIVVALPSMAVNSTTSSGTSNAEDTSKPTGFFVATNSCRNVEESYTESVPFTDQKCEMVPYTDRECEQKNIVYSVEDFTSNTECTSRDFLFFCNEETTTASLTINNHDDTGGTWRFGLYFMVDGEKNERPEQSVYVYPQSDEALSWSIKHAPTQTVSSQSYEAKYLPTKQVCRDVLKTKKECTSFTNYRTETRYRTVEKCD